MKRLTIFSLIFFMIVAALNAQTFKASNDNRNQAMFESDAPLENIVGVTNSISVVAMIDHNDITARPMGKATVDLTTLKSGIDLRDKHIRSKNWLDTDQFPNAVFELTGISSPQKKLEDGKRVKVTLHGKFTVHGVTHEVEAPGEITYFKENEMTKKKIKGNLLKIKAGFDVKLSDYGVKIPSMVVGKVNENIRVTVNFIASDAGTEGMMNPCNPCGMHKEKGMKSNPCGVHKDMKDNPCGIN